MKLKLFIPIGLGAALLVLPGLGQEKKTPNPDAFDPAVSGPLLIQVQVEHIELSHEKLTELLFEHNPAGNATALRKQVQALVGTEEAEVVETMICVTRSGQQATSESAREHIYPTEYEPPELPNNIEVDFGEDKAAAKDLSMLTTPATPTAFETRNVGSHMEVNPVLGPNGGMIELSLSQEVVSYTGQSKWQEMKDALGNDNKVVMPLFYAARTSGKLSCRDGWYVFAGVLTPKGEDGEADYSRKLMVFVKCDVIAAGIEP